ncbi:hypothetical protein [uncultured Treponema sp.]|nr:hypothetical protein [uncultured Treponema sp.]
MPSRIILMLQSVVSPAFTLISSLPLPSRRFSTVFQASASAI